MYLTDFLISFFFLMIYHFLPNNVLFQTTLEESVKVLIAGVHFLLSPSQFYRVSFCKNFSIEYSRLDGVKVSRLSGVIKTVSGQLVAESEVGEGRAYKDKR